MICQIASQNPKALRLTKLLNIFMGDLEGGACRSTAWNRHCVELQLGRVSNRHAERNQIIVDLALKDSLEVYKTTIPADVAESQRKKNKRRGRKKERKSDSWSTLAFNDMTSE